MNRIALAVIAVIGLGAAFAGGIGVAEAGDDASPTDTVVTAGAPHGLPALEFTPPATAAEKITNALAALPVSVRAAARVVDYPARVGDPYPELRAGTNEWTCFPDYGPSQGDDPTCYNRAGMQWLDAYYAGKKPKLTEPGVLYRLRGGSDASLSDVTAAEPPPGATWVLHGPHIVIIPTAATNTKDYPTTPGDHPWVMWRGTDYEHIHLPVG